MPQIKNVDACSENKGKTFFTAAGVHDVYIVFSHKDMSLESWQFILKK